MRYNVETFGYSAESIVDLIRNIEFALSHEDLFEEDSIDRLMDLRLVLMDALYIANAGFRSITGENSIAWSKYMSYEKQKTAKGGETNP